MMMMMMMMGAMVAGRVGDRAAMAEMVEGEDEDERKRERGS